MYTTKLLSMLKESDNNPPVTLRAIVPQPKVGSLLGRNGSVHQQTEDMFNVKVILHSPSLFGRITAISGRPDKVAMAWRECLLRMYEDRMFQFTEETECGLDFVIPDLVVNALQKNNVLEDIRRDTPLTISPWPRCLPNSTDRPIHISVSNLLDMDHLDSFQQAVLQLCDFMHAHPRLSQSPHNHYYIPNDTKPHRSTPTPPPSGAPPPPLSSYHFTEHKPIPQTPPPAAQPVQDVGTTSEVSQHDPSSSWDSSSPEAPSSFNPSSPSQLSETWRSDLSEENDYESHDRDVDDNFALGMAFNGAGWELHDSPDSEEKSSQASTGPTNDAWHNDFPRGVEPESYSTK
ncbi:hypothetical protein BCR43DRAFT_566008 [Syncephalastrum racemosum]|uniref:K Homology domain-containing protein n=1 Tax=Syncephalastrum racemosum TaxID=13706 RepID=A0A1X2H664_SYNRA|nr:hypothetical protein BCR43DRAFT_566008 [Syncephalastrum racemosum]